MHNLVVTSLPLLPVTFALISYLEYLILSHIYENIENTIINPYSKDQQNCWLFSTKIWLKMAV